MTASEENYLRTKRGTELTTQIRANGNISITAGHDLTMRAADILSKNGNTSLFAGNDINLTAGRETAEDHYGIRYKERGFLSGKTTAIRIDTASDIARSTNITGRNVSITAKRDASFTAANIAADHDVSIFAGRNIKAAAAENAHFAETYKAVKKSGVFSAGGLGFTIGKQETKTTHGGDALTQKGTSLAALAGNVALSAGERVHLTSANVQAGKEATVSAKEIRIDGKDNIYRERIVQEGIYDKFVAALAEEFKKVKVGLPWEDDTQMGAQVSAGQLDTILKYIKIGEQEGCRIITGGKKVEGELGKGEFIEPTLIEAKSNRDRIAPNKPKAACTFFF